MARIQQRLLDYIAQHPGLSDRQLTDAIEGRESPQQRINAEAKVLASRGQIIRRRRGDGILGNYPADATVPDASLTAEQRDATAVSYTSAIAPPRVGKVPACPTELPFYVSESVQLLGRLWEASSICPQVAHEVVKGWDELLAQWQEDTTLPLLVRKASSAVRGSELTHSTGRPIVPTDNSPAQWSCSLALQGIVPTVEDIRSAFANDNLPVSFAHKKHEKDKRRYHCTLGKHGVNKAGWKLCHVEPVGLSYRSALTTAAISDLKSAFQRLLSPSNYFLLPLAWGGLGEVKEFIDGYCASKMSEKR